MRSFFLPVAALLAAAAFAGCDAQSGAGTMPMAEPTAFDQPPPRAPLLADSKPQATPHYPVQATVSQPLPAAVPVPPRAVIEPSNGKGDNQADGGSSPAAGYASGITDARGDGGQHELGAEK